VGDGAIDSAPKKQLAKPLTGRLDTMNGANARAEVGADTYAVCLLSKIASRTEDREGPMKRTSGRRDPMAETDRSGIDFSSSDRRVGGDGPHRFLRGRSSFLGADLYPERKKAPEGETHAAVRRIGQEIHGRVLKPRRLMLLPEQRHPFQAVFRRLRRVLGIVRLSGPCTFAYALGLEESSSGESTISSKAIEPRTTSSSSMCQYLAETNFKKFGDKSTSLLPTAPSIKTRDSNAADR